ncbi:flavodoxin family protein, partial [Clostridium perfringens]
ILKGYIDRVFAYKFAYTYNGEGTVDKLLTGKKGVIISTYGTSEDYYEAIGMEEALKQTSGEGIFDFCGVEVAEQLLFGGVNKSVTDQERREMLERVRSLFSSF